MVKRVEKWEALKYNILQRWNKIKCNIAIEKENKIVFAEIAAKTICSKDLSYENMVNVIYYYWSGTEFAGATNNTWKFILIDLAIKEFDKLLTI